LPGATVLWTALAAAVVLAAAAVDMIDRSQRRGSLIVPSLPGPPPLADVAIAPAKRGASGQQHVLDQLAIADQQWQPRAEPLPGGGTRYVYRRRPGDPELSIHQIKALMANPPTFARERQVIVRLWQQIEQRGVRVELSQPRKPGAAGEWDPARTTVRIKPQVVTKGSMEFARVLNHEAIHVAQSCMAGSPGAQPQLLGLPQQLPPALHHVLQYPTYAKASERERSLEREAYANQDQLDLGLSLLRLYC